jgi:hypothetical protein
MAGFGSTVAVATAVGGVAVGMTSAAFADCCVFSARLSLTAPPELLITAIGEAPLATVCVVVDESALDWVVFDDPVVACGAAAETVLARSTSAPVPVGSTDSAPTLVPVVDLPVAAGPEPVADEAVSDWSGVAHATPVVLAIAAPTPNATARAPTRPM